MVIHLLLKLVIAIISVRESLGGHNLTFMFVTSFGQFGFNASGVVPAADIALEDINNDPTVLSGYHLKYDQVRDSKCHRGSSLDTYIKGILEDSPKKLAVIGCGCSVATEPVAEIAHLWNLSQISYSSSSAILSDRSRFKSFFRNTFNMQIIAPALRSMVTYFNWTRIALLTQEEGLFTGTETNIKDEFAVHNITVKSRSFETSENPKEVIEVLFTREEDYRVFFLNAYSGPARKIICYAHNHGYVYPGYAWIMYDWYPDGWWTQKISGVDDDVDCSDRDLAKFLDNALTIQLPDVSNETADVGSSLRNFEEKYKLRASSQHYNTTNQAYKLYDVMWVLALALNRTVAMIDDDDINGTGCEYESGSLTQLENFDYSNKKIGCLIQWNIQRTNFSGLTGRITFDINGTRIHTILLFRQYRIIQGDRLMKTLIAHVDDTQNFTFTFAPGIGDSDIYPGGPPFDGTPIKIIHTFETWLIVLFDTLSCMGIAFAIFCLIFNIIYRKRTTVRLSSPTLNYFIIVGAILMYASLFFYWLPTESEVVVKVRCVVEFCLFAIGYSFAIGAVLAKMWRVFQIFHNPQPNTKILTDWKLIVIVLLIAGATVLLLLIGETIPYLRGAVVLIEDAEHTYGTNSLGIRENYCVWVCQESSSASFFWQIFIFAYLVMLQIMGIVLAFQTRKVRLRGLRDSKYVAAIIYISSISIVVMALVTFALENYINVGTGILAVGIFLLTTMFLVLIFVPKMALVYQDPDRKNSTVITSQKENPMSVTPSQMPSTNETELKKKVVLLEKEVQDQENTIAELKSKLDKFDLSVEKHPNSCTEPDENGNQSSLHE